MTAMTLHRTPQLTPAHCPAWPLVLFIRLTGVCSECIRFSPDAHESIAIGTSSVQDAALPQW
jgi:hypothetical protein